MSAPTVEGPDVVLTQVQSDHQHVVTHAIMGRPWQCASARDKEPRCEWEGKTIQDHREHVASEQIVALRAAGWVVVADVQGVLYARVQDAPAPTQVRQVSGPTAGQVGQRAFLFATGPTSLDDWEVAAAAIVDHHVGPDRVVADRAAVSYAIEVLDAAGNSATARLLREALT